MKLKQFIIIIFLLFVSFGVQSQTIEEYKANLFYKIFNKLIFKNDASKTHYTVATYGCSEGYIKQLKSAKPTQFFTGLKFDFVKYNAGSLLTYDIIIIDKSMNKETNQIYTHVLSTCKSTGNSIAIFTDSWTNKKNITFNFVKFQSGFVNFEYNIENINKFNIAADISLKELNGVDLDAKELLEAANVKLTKIQQTLSQKEASLTQTIQELEKQQAKIEEQKQMLANQHLEIEEKQQEIKDKETELELVVIEMGIARQKLEQQQSDFQAKEAELVSQQKEIEEFQQKIEEIQKNYEEQKRIVDEKIAAIEEVSQQIEAKKRELKLLNYKIKIQRYALIIFSFLLGIIILLTVWIFRNYRKMKYQNNILEQQKNEIASQAEELEKANIELEKLSIVASKTNNAVAILDSNNDFDWVNIGFTKLYGYTLQLLKNEKSQNIEKTDLYIGIKDSLTEVIKKKTSISYEHESRTRDNKIMWIHSNITPILDYDDNIKQIVLVDTDVSEMKEAQDKINKQNKSIKNSILYASRIQKATLPSEQNLAEYLPDSFVLYLPRDIVSGDFYWSYKIRDKVFFSAADCTGHGVPGAFMSMLGVTLLNEIVSKINYDDLYPDIILNHLRDKIIIALKQNETSFDKKTYDGIDLALCMSNTNNTKLYYSGAHNELVHINNNKLTDYTADEMPIGISSKDIRKPFTRNEIEYNKKDMIYMFSDGYVDQFGGSSSRRKKFLIKRLRDIFIEIHDKPVAEQQKILLETHLGWRGSYRQIDDILVFGVRL